MYRLDYQYTHDIDWFCCVNGCPVHIASNGGHLPADSYTIDELASLQHQVANIKPTFQYEVNSAYLDEYLKNGGFYTNIDNISPDEFRLMLPEGIEIGVQSKSLSRQVLLYSWSFIEMAKRGFFSFDRKETHGREDIYHLVAWPKDYYVGYTDNKVLSSLINYHACCFPPSHDKYESDLPNYIKFDVDSCRIM